MKRRIALIAAATALLVGGATVASTASARDSFSIAIGAPGFAVGYSNHGYGYGYVAPPVVYSPPVTYYEPYYAAPPVVYGPPVTYGYYGYYRPYHRHRWHGYGHAYYR